MGEYWYLWALIIILIPVTVYVCYRASKAAKQNKEEREKIIAKLDDMKALKDEFGSLSAEQIKQADETRLLEGVALNTELKLQKCENANEDFDNLSLGEKNAYVLSCILEDSVDGVSSFFKKNTPPISPLAPSALKEAEMDGLAEIFAEAYEMYDENNESVSLDYDRLKELDEKFKSLFNADEYKKTAARYIKRNAADFAE